MATKNKNIPIEDTALNERELLAHIADALNRIANALDAIACYVPLREKRIVLNRKNGAR